MSQGGTKHIENKYVGVTQKHEIIKGYIWVSKGNVSRPTFRVCIAWYKMMSLCRRTDMHGDRKLRSFRDVILSIGERSGGASLPCMIIPEA